ncbi:hypothetical protein [Sphingobacterium siyangense]|uniref:hypothetical protein n=1 Tax=Sphingobacterium siyangense TaxID=459529 RepID=UPI002FDE9BE2
MKTNKENFAIANGKLCYEAPRLNAQQVELEQGIAAGSVGNSMTESWQKETQSQDADWQ